MIEYSIVRNWNTSKIVAPNHLETDVLRRFFQENVLFRFLLYYNYRSTVQSNYFKLK